MKAKNAVADKENKDACDDADMEDILAQFSKENLISCVFQSQNRSFKSLLKSNLKILKTDFSRLSGTTN